MLENMGNGARREHLEIGNLHCCMYLPSTCRCWTNTVTAANLNTRYSPYYFEGSGVSRWKRNSVECLSEGQR